MLSRLIARVRRSSVFSVASPAPAARSSFIEPLERRQLLSAALKATDVFADNRGEVIVTLNRAIHASAATDSSVILYLPGADKKIGTSDDVRTPAVVTYDAATKKITVHGHFSLTGGDLGYRVRLISSKLSSGGGKDLNYKVTTPAGDPTARITTTLGAIKIELFPAKTPKTVKNFLKYINSGLYDGTIIHRSVANFVIQGGGYTSKLDSNGLPTAIVTYLPIALEAKLSNTVGTIAMARTTDPNSANSQYFFNTVDNSASLDASTKNAGYAVFGKITNAAGLAVMNAIAAVPVTNLTPSTPNTAFNTVPEKNGQFIVIDRAAVIDNVTAF